MTGRFVFSSASLKGQKGITLITIIFALSVIAALALASLWITESRSTESVDIIKSTSTFYAAQSGLLWARQKTIAYTTADKALFNTINGLSVTIRPNGEEYFTLTVKYIDLDNDPTTSDKVTFTSTGFANKSGAKRISTTAEVSYTVAPPTSVSPVFVDTFDQPDTTQFDRFFAATTSPMAHGGGMPFTSVQNIPGGDTSDVFTHSREQGGVPGVLRMEALPFGDARLMIHTGSCLKWSSTGTNGLCGGATCISSADCQTREGVNILPDNAGFANYLIKMRVRLVKGLGFGAYFRATYRAANDPTQIDFARLTSYIWQYDSASGYLPPCDLNSAIPWSDGAGIFFARKVFNGSETCGAECEVFSSPNGGPTASYPFFCPENIVSDPSIPGWAWGNTDWNGAWRTISIYVYQDKATIWVGREEIVGVGGESDPLQTGAISLSSVGALLSAGDIGLRVWSGSVVEIDYLAVWGNDTDNNPTTFVGGSF